MRIPDALRQIAVDVYAGRVRRAKVRTLMGLYGLKRRREAGIAAVRGHLAELGLETAPDFETAGFDEQVQFVPANGAAVPAVGDGDEDAGPFRVDAEPGPYGSARYRVLMRTYDSFERLRSRLVEGRVASVYFGGQNARREDRDQFPFVLVVGLGSEHGREELARWAGEACALEPAQAPDAEPPAAPQASEPAESDVREHVADMAASLRAAFEREAERIREAVERKIDEIRFESVRKLAEQLNNDEALRIVEEFEAEYRARLEERDRTIRELSEELQLAYERIEGLAAEREEPDPADAFPTMVATVQLFGELCRGSRTSVLESAVKSAAKSACTRRREVLMLLLTIRDLGEALFTRGGTGKPIGEWFAERGYEYAAGDSEATGTRFGAERTVTVNGQSVQMSEHVTLFPNTNQCVSVYWWRDDAYRRLVVGYVGPHLRTVSR